MEKSSNRSWEVLWVFVGKENVTASTAVKILHCFIGGIKNDRHRWSTRFSMVRDIDFIPKGNEVLNLRQITVVSKDECDQIAEILWVENVFAEDLWANICIDWCDDLSKLPVWSMIKFSRWAYIMLTWDNVPCRVAWWQVQKSYPEIDDLEKNFVQAAFHRRWQTAMVYKSWTIKAWDKYEVIIPNHVQVWINYVKQGNL